MHRRRLFGLVAAVALGLGAAGCGGSSVTEAQVQAMCVHKAAPDPIDQGVCRCEVRQGMRDHYSLAQFDSEFAADAKTRPYFGVIDRCVDQVLSPVRVEPLTGAQLRSFKAELRWLSAGKADIRSTPRAAPTTLPQVEDESGTYCCVREFVAVKPYDIVFSVDGHALFAGARWVSSKKYYHPLTWKRWTATSATATGDLWLANPIWVSRPSGVRLMLWRPRRIRGYLLFTRITVSYASNKPPRAARTFLMTLDGPCYCDWSGVSGKDFFVTRRTG